MTETRRLKVRHWPLVAVNLGDFRLIERQLLGKAGIWPGRKAAKRSKAAIRLIWAKLSATHPSRPFNHKPDFCYIVALTETNEPGIEQHVRDDVGKTQ